MDFQEEKSAQVATLSVVLEKKFLKEILQEKRIRAEQCNKLFSLGNGAWSCFFPVQPVLSTFRSASALLALR